MLFHFVLIVIPAFALADCSGKSCADCTTEAGCGWCEGHAFDPSGERAPCLSLNSTSTWRCDGQFKNKGQCECSGTDIPSAILYPWRGFYIDKSLPGEVHPAGRSINS